MQQKVYMIKNEVERPSNTPSTKIGFGPGKVTFTGFIP